MKAGIYLPNFAGADVDGAILASFAQNAEEHDFVSLWVAEHMLEAPPAYATAMMSPLVTLSYVAAATERLRLGTGILILPHYHPVRLARDIVSLQQLSGDRLILGIGPGWSEPEFRAMGLDVEKRGRMTDEYLVALKELLTNDRASFKGEYVQFEDVQVAPQRAFPELWAAGRSPVDKPGGNMLRKVLQRIRDADRWFAARAVGNVDDIRADWTQISKESGKDSFAYFTFIHVVDTNDREAAIEEQTRASKRVLGDILPDRLAARAILGTPEDIIERLASLKAIGMDYVLFATMVTDKQQAELIARLIVPGLN